MTWQAEYARLHANADQLSSKALAITDPDQREKVWASAQALRDTATLVKAVGDRRDRPNTGPGSEGYRPFVAGGEAR